MKTANFNAHDFYLETMASVYQLIDQGELSSVNQVDDYLLSEAQYYVNTSTDEVITETLPDDFSKLNDEFGEISDKKHLAYAALFLFMDENNMIYDAIKHFSIKHKF